MILLNAVKINDALIKELQDKVISIQDHEISFLNDTIANTYSVVGIVVGIIGIGAVYLGTMIKRSNDKAQLKMEVAERIITEAKNTMDDFATAKTELEVYRQDTERKFTELTNLINSKEIDKLKEETRLLSIKHQVNQIITTSIRILEGSGDDFKKIQGMDDPYAKGLANEFKGCLEEMFELRKKSSRPLVDSIQGEAFLLRCLDFEKKSMDVCEKMIFLLYPNMQEE
ncbi:hypothetical protein L8956_04150 [Peribacillus frigoritolerans]|uniref:hypothetical protein n=1 Tax=Peribacillus frigoritolerans TaxID=450367 RepID=UPI001EFCDB1A|nr:hypothetical protein [Peribacillus frigoritolerans]ULM97930.1 hypothetical protein L8956_04150 [Peribacillus frigoritolerans]